MDYLSFLKKVFNYCYRRPMSKILRVNKVFTKFILPNLKPMIKGNLNLAKQISVQQIVLCQGSGNVSIGERCSFGFKLGGFWRGGSIELQARNVNSKIKIGNNIATNNNIMLCAANYIEIGDDTLIGQYVTIMDHEAHGTMPENRRKVGEIGKVTIGKNCWIGNNVTILKNTEIGNNTIIATGAVVSGRFPENVIIGGVPAKIIKTIQ